MKNRGWQVALAGTGINLALGVLYAWSIFKKAITDSITAGGEGAFQWDMASVNDPYALACLVFAFTMIIAGKFQDKFGPRLTAMLGGLLVGSGFMLISQTNDYLAWILGFGVLAGAGMGFGYSAATPPALKWFPPAKTGLIAGIVVSGFGLAPVYIAPLAKYLLSTVGLQQAMMIFGIGFTLIVCTLAMSIVNPPVSESSAASKATSNKPTTDYAPSDILKDRRFYLLWLIYFIGAGAGLMVIGSVAGMAKQSLGPMAFVAVAIMAVGNAGGRIVAGVLSDKIGRINTLVCMLSFQAILMFAAIPVLGANANAILLTLLATFIGFNYGTNLALFPSFAKDYWGLKNFGMNYGLLFTAWGMGAFVLVRVAETIKAASGNFSSAFALAGGLLIVSALLTFTLRTRSARLQSAMAH
ncbi:MAG: OFA family MFS transporter [Hahellaceae bacterium]|nr:OFA family MFS transporter [Hahellaceae bacterium]MCP5170075.1 OFA family MFS transporter [Hahellaceae bacterium]